MNTYQGESRFQKQFAADAIEVDTYAALLRSEVQRILQSKDVFYSPYLEELHNTVDPSMIKYDNEYGLNAISSLFYETDPQFKESYLFFVKSLQKHFDCPFYFQATPTVRIHCPNSQDSDFYPFYHSDIMLGHPPQEINIWVPLTEPVKPQYHGFRRMSVADSQQALPESANQVTTPLGKLLAFDSRCIHTAEPMLNHSRISMDVRILPVDDFDADNVYEGSGRRKVRYMPGEAYNALHSEEI